MKTTYRNILTDKDGAIAIVTLHRPKVLNALSHELMEELVQALTDFDQDEEVRAIVLTGSERAFAAGADIKEMSEETTIGIMLKDQFATWDRIKEIKKPIIAAVSGYALGGGCELMMNCDIIVAAESAQIANPKSISVSSPVPAVPRD